MTSEIRPDWDLSGAQEDLKVFFAVGYRVAEADAWGHIAGLTVGQDISERKRLDAELRRTGRRAACEAEAA
mgnify:CR=1 FL=1